MSDLLEQLEHEATHVNGGTQIAPEGQVWVCGACGKRARSRYGFDAQHQSTAIDRGWDESCMLNAVLCFAERTPSGQYSPVFVEDT